LSQIAHLSRGKRPLPLLRGMVLQIYTFGRVSGSFSRTARSFEMDFTCVPREF
jgi:hypothetical protein